MTKHNTASRILRHLPLLLTVAAVLLAFAFPTLSERLQYDHIAIAQGEWWRFLTSHLTHWTGNHLLWDLVMFVALAISALRISKLRTYGTLLAAGILIPIAVWIFQPEMIHYRGLSGLDSALFVFVLLELIKKQSTKIQSSMLWLMLISFVAKVFYEFITGNTLFVQSMGANISGVPLAHLVGGITGVLFASIITGTTFSNIIKCSVGRPRPKQRTLVSATNCDHQNFGSDSLCSVLAGDGQRYTISSNKMASTS